MANIQKKLEEARNRQKEGEEGKFPDSWKPDTKGQNLFGEVISIHPGFGKSADLIFWTVRDGTGKEWSILETITMSRAREKEKIIEGDQIGISFEGMGKTKSGRDFKKYVVVKA